MLLDLVDVSAGSPIVEPVTGTRFLSTRRLSDDVNLSCLTRLYLPLLQLHLDRGKVTYPFNLLKGDTLGDCDIRVVPLLTIHFPDGPCHDAVILLTTKDCRIQTGLDTQFHFTDSYGDDHVA
jgi:hypothetical protein